MTQTPTLSIVKTSLKLADLLPDPLPGWRGGGDPLGEFTCPR